MNETMRALVVRAPMDFSVETVARPLAPAGGLLLKVEACGLCGSDLRTLRSGHRHVTFPWTIGHEVAGTVAAVGSGYDGPWRTGERLAVGPLAYCGVCDFCLAGEYELCESQREIGQAWSGGLAEYLAVPAECVRLGNVRAVPAEMEPWKAAVVEPVSSCVNAQEKADVRLGDTVVVIGSGPIGCIHVALAKARGAFRVFVVDIDQGRLELAKPFGADALIDSTKVDAVAAVRELTGGKGATVVIAATPAPAASVQAVEMARKGGRVLQFGGLPKDDSKPGVDMNLVHYNGLHLIGTTTFAPKHNARALELIASGKVPAELLVTHRFPLEDFVEGAKLALAGKALKAVFEPGASR
jgi:L-iditol 2-dehydrogenase